MQYKPMRLPCHPVNLLADALALALVVGLPLFIPNGYIGLIGYKFDLLLRCVLITVVLLPFLCLLKNRCKTALRRFSFAWMWPVGLCICYGIACFFAEDRYTALWGLSGRKNGLVLYLVCTAAYLVITIAGSSEMVPLVSTALTGTGCLVAGISWLNYWMIDPLDAYYTFLPEKGELFLGTLGNINFYGAFLCLCTPVALWPCLYAKGRVPVWRYVSALWLCSGLIPAGSDAAWLGSVAAVLALCCTRKTTTRTLARLCVVCAGLVACALTTGFLGRVLPFRAELRTVSAWLSQPLIGSCLLLLCVVVAWGFFRVEKRRAAVGARVITGVLILLVITAFFAANFLLEESSVLSFLHFDERWAANRGYAWQKLWVIYTEDTTLLQKIFGLGGDAVKACLNPDIESIRYMVLLNGDIFDSAHNEFLQHLICGGAAGLLCWCVFLGTALLRGFKQNPPLAAALLGYAVQSFFSISMPGVLPLFFVLAACVNFPQAGGAWQGKFVRVTTAAGLLFLSLLATLFIGEI